MDPDDPVLDPRIRRWPQARVVNGATVYELVYVNRRTREFVVRHSWEGTPKKDDARRIITTYASGAEDTNDYDADGRLIRTVERDAKGKLTRVTVITYFADGSAMKTVTDYSVSPAQVTQQFFPK